MVGIHHMVVLHHFVFKMVESHHMVEVHHMLEVPPWTVAICLSPPLSSRIDIYNSDFLLNFNVVVETLVPNSQSNPIQSINTLS